jgi:uncharacterized protein
MTHEFHRSEDQARYEIQVEGELAGVAEYREVDGRVVFTHTRIEDDHEGEGLGSELVRGALEDVRQRGVRIIPQCPFVARFVDEHEEYRDLVDDDLRQRL